MTAPYEAEHLAGEIVTDIYEEFWRKDNYRFGSPGVDYEMVGTDEGMELGAMIRTGPWCAASPMASCSRSRLRSRRCRSRRPRHVRRSRDSKR